MHKAISYIGSLALVMLTMSVNTHTHEYVRKVTNKTTTHAAPQEGSLQVQVSCSVDYMSTFGH